MATDATAGPDRPSDGWSPARIFMAVSAAYHVPLGLVGLAMDPTFPLGAEATVRAGSVHILGIFETNGWHSLAALLIGVASIFFAVRPDGARAAALAIGVGHVGIVVSLAVLPPSTFWFASNGADQFIHTLTAIGGIGSGLLTRPVRRAAWTSA